ncbi:MAG: TonB-dependent receptor [Cyclobacteriaceae bacterium]|nr:TonB-dependent receptor [Cyclobacteriaceae bacterium]MCH8516058.1 TonB-dependent receptor [Cyclobacteriaceae bacterium]
MKNIYLSIAVWFISITFTYGQESFTGQVIDAKTKEGIPFASIQLKDKAIGTTTDETGTFILHMANLPTDLIISHVGYRKSTFQVSEGSSGVFSLESSNLLSEEVIVKATRASEKQPFTFSQVDRASIEKQNFGQDLPLQLQYTPSLVATSDAGNGVGYTGMRIRGSDPTRINVTINGIPLNDSESHGVFWVNMPDFASSVESIQIQRGVGTSTNGAAAFGASVNVQTDIRRDEAYAEVESGYGSFNTLRNTVKVGSGLINDHFTFDARLSQISSDGFIDRAFTDLRSFFLSGAYHGEKSLLKLNIFSGQEQTFQAWNGVPESRLRNDQEGMLDFIARNGLDQEDADNLLNSNSRTFNAYLYENETDNYQQDHYQLIGAHEVNTNFHLNAALHYTRGRGYFEQFRKNDRFSTYGLEPIEVNGELINRTDLIRRRWLDNHFYGATYSAQYVLDQGLEITAGGGWNRYDGDHFGEVIWARFSPNLDINDRYYDNNAVKIDHHYFAKAEWMANEKWNIYADLQYRMIDYSFEGPNVVFEEVVFTDQQVNFGFFNPKFGLSYLPSVNHSLYASFSRAGREPVRRDFTESSPESRPRAEILNNIEAGWRYQQSRWSLNVNYYLMSYTDQLVLTGQINDVGAFTRTNVDDSYRTGIEIDAGIKLTNKISWNANITLSRNKIRSFTEFVDNFDTGMQEERVFKNTDLAMSPNVISGSILAYRPYPKAEIALLSKYVGRQFLDNTQNENRSLDAYFINDIRLSYSLEPKWLRGIDISLLVNNVFDQKFESNGYTFGYIAGGSEVRENFFFPQAGVNVMSSIAFKF